MTSKPDDFQRKALIEVVEAKKEKKKKVKRKRRHHASAFVPEAAFEVRANLKAHLEDPFILHAATESYTYMCDMLARIGVPYSHEAVVEMAKVTLGLQAIRKQREWSPYVKRQAPKVIEEILDLLPEDEANEDV